MIEETSIILVHNTLISYTPLNLPPPNTPHTSSFDSPIMQPIHQSRHLIRQEHAVDVDGVAREDGRALGGDPFLDVGEHGGLDGGGGVGGGEAGGGEAGLGVELDGVEEGGGERRM